jgi:hypothetical protein
MLVAVGIRAGGGPKMPVSILGPRICRQLGLLAGLNTLAGTSNYTNSEPDVADLVSSNAEMRTNSAALLAAATEFGKFGWTVSPRVLKSTDYVDAVRQPVMSARPASDFGRSGAGRLYARRGVIPPAATLDRLEWGEWSRHSDLNRGPAVYETAALPLSYVGAGRV